MVIMEKTVILSLMLTCVFMVVQSHVRLTFPPARYFQLEYFDVYRHSGPCGTKRTSATPHTTFLEGTTFTVTWHLSWPHQGGARIDVIQEEGDSSRVLRELTPGYVLSDDTTAQAVEVTLPHGLVCDNCTLRLTRQGAEFGSRYGFWSCGDITIMRSQGRGGETTGGSQGSSSQGSSSSGSSNDSYLQWILQIIAEVDSGIRRMDQRTYRYLVRYAAQLTTPAPTTTTAAAVISTKRLSDADCYEGKCLNGGTCNEKTGACQCHRLFTGSRCENQDECWTDEDCNYHGQCIDTRSTSYPKLQCYCSRGWFGRECEKESQITEVLSSYENNPNYMGAELRRNVANIYWRYVRRNSEIEIVLRIRSNSWVGVGWKPVGILSNCKITDSANLVQERQAQAQRELLERQSSYNTTEPSPHGDPEIESENRCSGSGRKKRQTDREPSFFRVYAAMDCSDIVIGAVKGNLYRIYDTYTNDRETPRADSFYGGVDDITSAMGTQVNGITTIVFRKPVTATHYTDQSITQNRMTVIWARGQECRNRFYRHDELKFHGYGYSQKSSTTLTFTRSPPPPAVKTCTTESGSIRSPANCQSEGSGFNCAYFVSWSLQNDQITFVMKARQNKNMYIALGISDDRSMPSSDIYVGWIDASDNVVLSDRYATARQLPPVDSSQDYVNAQGSHQGGVLTIQFARSRISSDSQDISFTDSSCRHLLLARGPITNNNPGYHSFRQTITQSKICIRSCRRS